MKYIILTPILVIYLVVILILAGLACMWSFDFNNFKLKSRNISHKIGLGYWLQGKFKL